MKVLKFGGTSVGSAQRMKDVAKLITDGEQKIVVLSAMSGTTNTLVEISEDSGVRKIGIRLHPIFHKGYIYTVRRKSYSCTGRNHFYQHGN